GYISVWGSERKLIPSRFVGRAGPFSVSVTFLRTRSPRLWRVPGKCARFPRSGRGNLAHRTPQSRAETAEDLAQRPQRISRRDRRGSRAETAEDLARRTQSSQFTVRILARIICVLCVLRESLRVRARDGLVGSFV